jgi:uncharacterized Zn finger protein (UPF0148 family)
MFDELARELRRLEGTHQIPVSIPSDADGYFDRQCPADECQFQFKMHEEDWRHNVRGEEIFCPFCGHTADYGNWCTEEQTEHLRKTAINDVQQRIGRAMKSDEESWNRRQSRSSFIRITMKVDSFPQQVLVPLAAVETMRLKITCSTCGCRHAVIGAAFFCPTCGDNTADLTFMQAITGIRNALDNLATVREAIIDKDIAETTIWLIVENGLQNAVTAFQRYAEALYARFPSLPAARRNAFQNLREGSDLWHKATGKQYGTYLDPSEQAALTRFFQQRHLLAHTQGIVDGDYIARTRDTAHRIGQRLVLREAAVRECLALIEKLGTSMASDAM